MYNGDQHLAIRFGQWGDEDTVPLRVQSALSFPEIHQLIDPSQSVVFNRILESFKEQGKGLLVIMQHKDKQPDLLEMLRRLGGDDTAIKYRMDQKDYGIGAQIIRDQGIRKLTLLSDSPVKRVALEGYGLEMVSSMPLRKD